MDAQDPQNRDQDPTGVKLLDSWITSATDGPILSLGRYSAVVGKLKYIIGIVIALLIALLLLWPLIYPVDQPLKLNFKAIESKVAEPSAMINPRFHGIDKHNRPYNIRADKAFKKGDNIISVTNVSGEIAVDSQRFVMIRAGSGDITVDGKSLTLTGDVNIFTSEGYEVKTTDTQVDLAAGIATGMSPIQCQGPIGTLNATGFTMDAFEETLDFTGPVHVTIYPPSRKNK